MTKLRTILAGNIRAYRNEKGFSQEALAELVGTAPNYIAMIEQGRSFPRDAMLERIAAALGKEPAELFSMPPVRSQLREALLAEFADFLSAKLGK
ncbi:MAG: helix-turn-helix transcriptional regulator [Treponema sp.]|nr:helix-turn-helix transcriptional regulator [Treponema sp.]